MMQKIITFFERYSFGVCTYLGEKFNVSISKIRLFFIYSSFLAVGFPLIFYVFAGIGWINRLPPGRFQGSIA